MDIRMPVMNGYEAAAEIRRLRRSDAQSVPIIAMSADAYAEDVKKCLDAGMNAHIPEARRSGNVVRNALQIHCYAPVTRTHISPYSR
jgi:CheY-like chemotaxis protein